MRTTLLIGSGALGIAGIAVVALLWNGPQDAPTVLPKAGPLCGDNASDERAEESPEKAAAEKMLQLASATERIEHIKWVSQQDWAKSNLPVLRTTIVSDPDEEVQLAAVEESLSLALKEGGAAPPEVVRTALASTKGNTRARGLKAAREHPDTELVPTLLELVDNKDPYATMALNALAYTNSGEAHAKILAVAEDDQADKTLRERAVSLLGVTRDREARPLLVELANGEDEALRRIATEVLRVLNEG